MSTMVALGERLYGWLADASLVACALVVALLVAELLGKRWLTPRWRYALWMLLMIRLALPFVPELPRAVPGWRLDRTTVARFLPRGEAPSTSVEHASLPADRALLRGLDVDPGAAGARAPSAATLAWAPPSSIEAPNAAFPLRATLAWSAIGVALALFVVGLARALRFERRIARARPVSDPSVRALFDDSRRRMRVTRDVELLESEDVTSPALVGIRRPRVLLPARRTRDLSGRSLELVFCHELAHLRGRDIELGLFLLALRSCFWFHPLVWVASARLATAREAWRDWQALAAQPDAAPDTYARTLLSLAGSRSPEAAHTTLLPVHWNRTHELRRRIQMIHAFHLPTRRASICGFALVGAFAWMSMAAVDESPSHSTAPQDGLIRFERASEPPAWRVALDRTLARRFDVALRNQSFDAVIAELRRVSGANLVVEPEFLESYRDTPLDLELEGVTLEEALDVVCRSLGEGTHAPGLQALVLGYDVGPPERELRIYQVQSLLDGAEEGSEVGSQLIDIVQSGTATVEGGVWDEEGAWVECWNGLLFVNQTPRVHARVQAVLEFLASGGTRPAVPQEPWREPLIAALARPADIDVEKARLKDVVAALSATHGVAIQCDPDVGEEEITLELHDVDLGTVLAWVGKQAGLRPRLASGTILLDSSSGELELSLYELEPLYEALPTTDREETQGFLEALLREQVDPGSWDADPLLEIRFWRSKMLVRQTPAAQRSIAAVLAALGRSLAGAGPRPGNVDSAPAKGEIRISLSWDESARCTLRRVDDRVAANDDDFARLLELLSAERTSATIDASPQVPWEEVIRVLNLCTKSRIANVEFASPPEETAER